MDHQGLATLFGYDDGGNRTSTTDPIGRASRSEYDALNRLSKTINTVSPTVDRSTAYTYDAHDNVQTVTNPLGHVTTRDHDGLDNLLALDSPDTGVASYEYDAAGSRTQRRDARGVEAQFTYDGLNRVTTIRYPSDTSFNVTFTYDQGLNGIGRLTTMSDGLSGVTTWSYDALGRVVAKSQTANSGTSLTVRLLYDEGRTVGIIYPSGQRLGYDYDAAGQVVGVTLDGGGLKDPPTPFLNRVEYLPFGPASRFDFARSLDQDRLYGFDFEPEGFAGGLERSYGTNAAGEIESISVPGSPEVAYTYDSLGRMTNADSPRGTPVKAWSYDLNGNRLSDLDGNYEIAADSNRLLQGFQSFYQYDAMGNTASFFQARLGSRQMQYGPNQRLAFISGSGRWFDGQYLYNGRGERVAKMTTRYDGGDGVSKQFLYDEAGKLLGEYGDDETLIMEYLWLDDSLIGLNKSGVFYQVYTDHLGTPRAVRDSLDVTVWEWESLRSPFGDSPPDGDPDGDDESFVLNLRFPGQYHDIESGFSYNTFRDYDPATGRYIESDPIGLAGGLNTYAYAEANPVKLSDPLGLSSGAGCFIEPLIRFDVGTQMVVANGTTEPCRPLPNNGSGQESLDRSECEARCRRDEKSRCLGRFINLGQGAAQTLACFAVGRGVFLAAAAYPPTTVFSVAIGLGADLVCEAGASLIPPIVDPNCESKQEACIQRNCDRCGS